MADLEDVVDALVGIAAGACYPAGSTAPSVTGVPITIGPGWPKPEDLDSIFAQNPPQSMVTVFPVPGATGVTAQFLDDVFPPVIVPPVHGMTATVSGTQVAVSGQPNVGEYLTLVVDGRSYSYVAAAGDTTSSVLSQLATQMVGAFPQVSVSGSTITIPGAYSIIARVGAPGTLGRIIHRQKQQVRISIWAPNYADRTTIAKAVDVALKQNLRLTFPDTSQGILIYASTMFDDNAQVKGAYIRHLVYTCEYATIEEFPGYEITSVPPNNTFSIGS